MRDILDWVFVVLAAVSAPLLYAQLGAVYVDRRNLILPELYGPLPTYLHSDWLALLLIPLLIPLHLVFVLALKSGPRARIAAILAGASAQGGVWAALAGMLMLLVMSGSANFGLQPPPISTQISRSLGGDLALIAAVTYAILGAVSGALAGSASARSPAS